MGQRSRGIFLGKFDQGGQFLPPPLLETPRRFAGNPACGGKTVG
jgi:hypothetical protein